MADRIVTHVARDANGNVTDVGQPGADWSPRRTAAVIADIEAGMHRYFVAGPAGAGPRIHVVHDHGGYLRSGADDVAGNNLDSLPMLFGGQPPATCAIGWQPSVLAPVFYGVRDLTPDDDGAPGHMRVFFPSLDGAVHSAPILEGCGRYPLILFAHGNCAEDDHHRNWLELPAQLARSGYVVAVPALPSIAGGLGPWADDHPDMDLLADIMAWMRSDWEHQSVLLPEPATGIAGHSWGALLAGQFATEHAIAAYVSLSGTWSEWPPVPPSPLSSLEMPKLFTWGTGFGDLFAALGQGQWDALPGTKHRAAFTDAGHWDYFPEGRSDCEELRGSCTLVPSLAMDLVACHFATYLPPECWAGFDFGIPDSLVPPPLTLTADQQFFAGAHLTGFPRLVDQDQDDCEVELAWDTSRGSGTTLLP